MHFLILILAVLSASHSWAAGTVVSDGGTLRSPASSTGSTVSMPELDQMCIEHADGLGLRR
jgi:hypothetical protein